MKSNIGYRDVAREIIALLTKYDVTYKDLTHILGWLDSEISVQLVQVVQDSTD